MNNSEETLDKLQFIFHRIIIGVISWIIMTFIIAYQEHITDKGILINTLLYLLPMLIFIWFIKVSLKKNPWSPFKNNSSVIGAIIILIGYLIPFFTFHGVKVIQIFP